MVPTLPSFLLAGHLAVVVIVASIPPTPILINVVSLAQVCFPPEKYMSLT